MRRCRWILIMVLVMPLVTGGCGAPPRAHDATDTTTTGPAWPPPPAEPRIRYVRSVSGPKDWGIEKSLFQRAIDNLVGHADVSFVRPTAVAEQNGVLYIADPGVPALWILDAAENRFVKADRVGETAFLSPVAVAVRPDGAVFVADSALAKVFLVNPAGELIRIAAEEGLERPAGLAYDADAQRLYVADAAKHSISVYGPDGALIATRGQRGTGDGEFNFPTHLTLDRSGTMLVTDALNFRVQAFDRDGRFLWKLGHPGDGAGDFSAPKGVAADSEGHVYVVDALFDAVQIFDREGAVLLSFGEQGSRAGQFWLPGGVFITARDQIFVADAYNRRVQVFLEVPAIGKETRN